VGVDKALAIVAECKTGPGWSGGGASCAIKGTACPPPIWPAQWNLTLSTVFEPGSDVAPSWFDPPQPWGLVQLDWSVSSDIWLQPNMNDSTVEATSVEGCRRIKAASPGSRCGVYHNFELAIQALESQRAVMYDSGKSHWFLRYPNGSVYNEPGSPGDQYFFDMRVPEVVDFYITSSLALLSDPAVDVLFTDDFTGFPAEHDYGPGAIGMTAAELADVQLASLAAHGRLIDAVTRAGKYVWQAMGQGYEGEYTGPGVSHSTCLAFMLSRCGQVAWQERAWLMAFDDSHAAQSVAAFLIARGPWTWLGYGWESGSAEGSGGPGAWHPLFATDVGEPTGACAQTQPGVFTRA
jgi:hypothetical protein